MGNKSWLFFCLFSVIGSAFSKPSKNECSLHKCDVPEDSKFYYDVGRTFVYEYETETSTTLQNVGDEAATLSVSAIIELEILTPCEFAMKMKEVNLQEVRDLENGQESRHIPARANEFRTALEQHTIRFAFHDGDVQTLCPSDDEPAWVLNVKRGVLSLFHLPVKNFNVRQKFTEVDVSGSCETHFKVTEGWRSTLVRKKKILENCANHQLGISSLQANPFMEGANLRSLPLLKGTKNCEQLLSSNILEKASCEESHLLRPFSSAEGGGAVTRTVQAITFVREKNGIFTEKGLISKRTSLMYDFTKPGDKGFSSSSTDAHTALRSFCHAIREDVRPETPHLFAAFVQSLRPMDYFGLNRILNEASSICDGNPNARFTVIDALLQLGTDASARLMRELIEEGIPDSVADSWFVGLGSQSQPTANIIAAVSPLLDSQEPRTSAYLGISSLVYTFCRSNSRCWELPEVQDILKKLERNLGPSCKTSNDKDKIKVILSLKALGNIGAPHSSIFVLERCFADVQNSLEVRLAAIQAYRRFPCDTQRLQLLRLFVEPEVDPELRIAAYLEVMRCPSKEVIDSVRLTMESETVNQVGSFVWTHLMNLQDSDDYCKADIQALLSDMEIQSKFSADARKFSRAFEGSFFSEALNVGAHTDAYILFTSKSYIPRSAMLNLTVDIFGHSVNLFEIAGRMEGFEELVESMFGPGGMFPDRTVLASLRSLREGKKVDDEKLNDINNRFSARKHFSEEPSVSMGVKVFGNELLYSTVRGADGVSRFRDLWHWPHLFSRLVKERDIELSHSTVFLDSILVVSTSSGFPLLLRLNGTAAMTLNAGGHLDLRRMASKNFYIDGHLKPSAAVKVTGSMEVDAFATTAGVKLVSTLHTSTFLEGKVEVRNGEFVRAHLNVPKDKAEILDFSSELFVTQQQVETPVRGVQVDRTELSLCTGALTSRPLGMEMCGELRYPNASRLAKAPSFPLTGPAGVRLFLRKTDPSLSSYQVDYRWETDKISVKGSSPQYVRNFLASFKTPRAAVDRELTAELIMSDPDQSLSLRFITPFKKIVVNGKYNNDPHNKKLDATLVMDDDIRLLVNAELRMERTDTWSRIIPSLHVRFPGRPLLSFTGFMQVHDAKKLTLDLKLEHLTSKPITLSGEGVRDVRRDNIRFDWDLAVSSPILDANIKGSAVVGKNTLSLTFDSDYSWRGADRESIHLSAKLRNRSSSNRSLTRLSATADLQMTAFPQYNAVLDWEFQSTTGHVENTLKLGFGPDPTNEENKLKMQQILSYTGSYQNSSITGTFSFSYPLKGIDFGINLQHRSQPQLVKTQLSVRLDPRQEIAFYADLNDETSNFTKQSANFELRLPSRTLALRLSLVEEKRREFNIDIEAQWEESKKVQLNILFKNLSKRVQLNYTLQANLSLPGPAQYGFGGHFFAAENRMAAGAEVTFEDKLYAAEAELTRPPTDSHRQYRFTASVIFPSITYSGTANLTLGDEKLATVELRLGEERRIVANATFRIFDDLRAFQLELLWDADRDSTRRLTAEGEYRRVSQNEITGQLQLWHPDRWISLKFGSRRREIPGRQGSMHTTHIEVQWEKDSTAALDVEVSSLGSNLWAKAVMTTPFEGLERSAFEFEHQFDGAEWNTTALVTWGPQSKSIALRTHLQAADLQPMGYKADAFVRLTTPFEGAEDLSVRASHLDAETQTKSKLIIQWDVEKMVELSVYATDTSFDFTKINGGFNISTPWDGMRGFASSFQHELSDERLDSFVQTQWDNQHLLALSLRGTRALTEDRDLIEGSLQLDMPFEGYERLLMALQHRRQPDVFHTRMELKWRSDQSAVLLLDGQSQGSIYNQTLEASVGFTSPWPGLEDLGMMFSHFHSSQSFESLAYFRWTEERSLNLTFYGSLNRKSGLQGGLLIDTPWPDYRRLSMEGRHQLIAGLFNTSLYCIAGERTLAFAITGKYDFSQKTRHLLQGRFLLEIPLDSLHKVELSALHTRQHSTFFTQLYVELNGDNLMGYHHFHLVDLLNFNSTLVVKTPMENFRTLNVTVKQSHVRGEFFTHLLDAEWADSKRVTGGIEYKNQRTSDRTIFQGKIHLETPFEGLQKIKLHGEYFNRGSNCSAFVSAQYQKLKLEVIGQLLLDPHLKAVHIEFVSPFSGYETLILSGKYGLSDDTYVVELLTQWTQNKKIDFSGKVFPYLQQNPWFQVRLLSHFSGFDHVELNGRLVSNNGSPLVSVLLRKSDIFVDGSISWSIKELMFDSNLIIKTSFIGFESVIFTFKYDFAKAKKELIISLEWPQSNKVMVEMALEWNGFRLFNGAFNIRSPLKGLEMIAANASFEQTVAGYDLFGLLQWSSDRKIEAKGSLNFDASTILPIQLMATVTTPYHPVQSLRLVATAKGQKDATTTKYVILTTLQWTDNKLEVNVDWIVQAKTFQMSIKMTTPFSNFPSMNVSCELLNNDYRHMEARINLMTPFEGMKQVNIHGQLQADGWTRIDGSLSVNAPGKSLSITAEYTNADNEDIAVKLSLDAPFTSFSTAFLDSHFIRMDGGRHIEASVTLTVADRVHSIAGSMEWTGTELKGQLKLESTFFSFRNVVLNLGFKKGIPLEGSVQIFTPDKSNHLTLSFKADGWKAGETRLTLESPHFWLSSFAIDANYKSNELRNIEGIILLTLPKRTYQTSLVFKNPSYWSEIDAILNLNLPFEVFPSLKVNGRFKHNGWKSLEGALDLTTPWEGYEDWGIAATGRRTQEQTWDITFNGRTPIPNYDLITIEGTLYYNNDVTNIQPQFTLNLPSRQISISGQVNRLPGDLESSLVITWDRIHSIDLRTMVKYSTTNIQATGILHTPFAGYENVNTTFLYEQNAEERFLSRAEISYPTAAWLVQLEAAVLSLRDLEGVLFVRTPSHKDDRFLLKLIHRLKENEYLGMAQCKWAPATEVMAAIDHAVLHAKRVEGVIRLNTPFDLIRNSKTSYHYENTDVKFDVGTAITYHQDLLIDAKITSTEGSDQGETGPISITKKIIEIENKFQPLGIILSTKSETNGDTHYHSAICWDFQRRSEATLHINATAKETATRRDVTIQTTHPNRIMTLKSDFERTDQQIRSAVEFSWNQYPGSVMSYDAVLQDKSTDKQALYDIRCRFDHPIRSLSLNGFYNSTGIHTDTTVDFRWDAARDDTKKISLKVDHLDDSRDQTIAHKIKIILMHPRLEKDVSLRGDVSISPGREMFSGRLEADYSRYQRQKLTINARLLNELLGRNQESHYSTEINMEHQAAAVDLKLLGDLFMSPTDTALNGRILYVDQHERLRSAELRSKLLRQDQRAEIIVKLPSKLLATVGYLQPSKQGFEGKFYHKVNGNDTFTADLQVLYDDPSGNLLLLYDPETAKAFQIKGGLRTNKAVILEVVHRDIENEVQDAISALRLSHPYLLIYRLHWRPTILTDLKSSLKDAASYIVSVIQNQWTEFSTFALDEAKYKLDKLQSSVSRALEPMTDEILSEMRVVEYDLLRIRRDLEDMYRANHFYLRDIVVWTKDLGIHFMEYYEKLVEFIGYYREYVLSEIEKITSNLRELWESIYEILQDNLEYMIEKLQEVFMELWQKIQERFHEFRASFTENLSILLDVLQKNYRLAVQMMQDVRDFVVERIRLVWKKIEEFRDALIRKWNELKTAVYEFLQSRKEFLFNHEIIHRLKQWFLKAYEIIKRFWKEEIYDVIMRQVESIRKSIMENKGELLGRIIEYAQYIYYTVKQFIKNIREHPYVVFVIDSCNQIYQKTIWILDYWNLYLGPKDLAWKLFVEWRALTARTGYQSGNKYDTLNRFLFVPQQGRVEMDQYLPMPWYALTQTPRFDHLSEVQLYELLRRPFTSSGGSSFWDVFYKYRPFCNKENWMPPFQALAVIAGKQHFVTFDKTFYDFIGSCTYLLAHDFINHNFTLTLTHDKKSGRKVYTFLLGDRELDVTSDSIVKLNGKTVELPQKIGDAKITRFGSIITVQPTASVLFRCNLAFDVCSLRIGGWYFGRTGGLLGTYSNEPGDDLITPDRISEPLPEIFAASWNVGTKHCKADENHAVVVAPLHTKFVPSICKNYFQKQLSFKFCFKQVDPTPYMEMCASDLATKPADDETAICTSAAAYIEACNFVGIPLSTPKNCVRCSLPDGSIIVEGDNITLSQKEMLRSTDVVFVIEAHQCNAPLVNVFPEIVKTISDTLSKERFTQNRYSIVVFGGGGDYIFDFPHTQTINGDVFSNDISFIPGAINNIAFGNGTSDIFGSLRFAATLPFRVGVSKTFIVFMCSKCNEVSSGRSHGMTYPEVHRMLLEDGIKVHLFLPLEFHIKGTKDFYGIDGIAAYTAKHARQKNITGDQELRRQVSVPKDMCVPLAIESNGTVFSTLRLLEGKKKTKSFLDVFCRRMAKTAQPPSCHKCDCVPDNEGVGKMHCQPCTYPYAAYVYQHPDLYGLNDDIPLEADDDIEDALEAPIPPKGKGRSGKKRRETNQSESVQLPVITTPMSPQG